MGRGVPGRRITITAVVALSLLIFASALIASLAAPAAADATSAAPTPAPLPTPTPTLSAADLAKICSEVGTDLVKGQLDQGVSRLLSVLPGAAADSCIAREVKIAAQPELSRGRQAIIARDLDSAEQAFYVALLLDPGNVAAQQGLADVAQRRASVPKSNWDAFYANRIEAAYRIIGAFLIAAIVLFIVSAQTSGFLVGVDAVVWPRGWQTATRVVGAVLLLAMAAFLPIYPMFEPLSGGRDVVPGWSIAVVATVVAFIALALCFSYQCFRTSELRQGKSEKWVRRRFRRDWWRPPIAIGVVVMTGTALWCFALTTPYRRLMLAYAVLVLLGVIITGMSFGQNCRLQVQVLGADGRPDNSATDYLLARLRTLGMEQTPGLNVANLSGSISSLQEQDLSGIPGGRIAGTLTKILFALRPDLTWQVQVTIVDEGRAAIRLSRNGRLAFAGIFSRKDLGIGVAAPDTTAATAQAHSQLLTGAAAATLTHLSLVHPTLREGLCGATEWRSVALQVIASSVSLAEGEDPAALLRKAVNMDPGNSIARFEYIQLLEDQFKKKKPYDLMVISMYDDAIGRALEPGSQDVLKLRKGWESLYLKLLYNASVASVTLCIERLDKSDHDTSDCLTQALARVKDFSATCDHLSDWNRKYPDSVVKDAQDLKPFAGMLKELVVALHSKALSRASERKRFDYPRLSFNSACVKALTRTDAATGEERTRMLKALIAELAFATPTDEARERAATDSYLKPVYQEKLFSDLVCKPMDFLDLAPFAPFKAKLANAQLTDAGRFAAATGTRRGKAQVARFIEVPYATVDHLNGIAAIGAIHPDLNDADMLQLLLGLGIDSTSLLRKQVDYQPDRLAFKQTLRSAAGERGLKDLMGVRSPESWMRAVLKLPA